MIAALAYLPRPEGTRHAGKVSNKSGGYTDAAVVVTEVELKQLVHPPEVVIEHFQNRRSGKMTHNPRTAFINNATQLSPPTAYTSTTTSTA